MIAVLQYPGTLSASSDTHNLHIFSSFLFFVRSRLASWSRAKKKTKGEEKRGLNSSHLAILSLAHTPEHYTNMVKHNNEIPHQHFKKDWQGYVILSFYAASIIRVLENARRNAFIFSLFCFTRTNLRIHPFFYYRNCSQSFVRTWFNQAGRKKSRRIGTFIQFLFELRHRGWRFWVHFRPSHFALSSANKALSPKFSLVVVGNFLRLFSLTDVFLFLSFCKSKQHARRKRRLSSRARSLVL